MVFGLSSDRAVFARPIWQKNAKKRKKMDKSANERKKTPPEKSRFQTADFMPVSLRR